MLFVNKLTLIVHYFLNKQGFLRQHIKSFSTIDSIPFKALMGCTCTAPARYVVYILLLFVKIAL